MNTGTRERGRVAPVPRVQQHAFVRGPLKTRWFYLANPAGSWHSRGGLDREVCTAGVAILVTIPLRHRSHSNHLDSKSKTSPHKSVSLFYALHLFSFFLFLSLSLRENTRGVSLRTIRDDRLTGIEKKMKRGERVTVERRSEWEEPTRVTSQVYVFCLYVRLAGRTGLRTTKHSGDRVTGKPNK